MSKTFRPWLVDQPQLLPPSVLEFVPEGHVAHFVRNLVRDELDLSAILDCYGEERGYPPYHPMMMTALLLLLQEPLEEVGVAQAVLGGAVEPGGQHGRRLGEVQVAEQGVAAGAHEATSGSASST